LIAIPALTRDQPRRVVVTPGFSTTVPPVVGQTGTTAAGTTGAGATPTSAAGRPPAAGGYQPLYPFRSLAEANAWQAGYLANGAQPWHLDPGQTALSFARFLGYQDVTTVFGVRTDAAGAHVTVGFPNPNGQPVSSAVVHLRRFGSGNNAPWEVVGTDDTPTFSLTKPGYGAVVTSPFAVGGAITGVDENIRVEVLQLSSTTPIGTFCCQPAGNTGQPWSANITFHGASDPGNVLTVAASTGGHLAAVERFTVTGVRTSGGSTPGL
jgi:hypothetical protein